jgi:hypothetical protein
MVDDTNDLDPLLFDNELDPNASILTQEEFLEIGLKVFFTEERIKTF